MTLEQYLEREAISLAEFARRIGAKNARTVQRYVKGLRRPSMPMMDKITRETGGAVQASDYLDAVAE